MSHLPFGAGTGSFVRLLPQFEKQTDLINVFANGANNDFVEAALESGVLAVLLMLVFAVWFVRAGIRVWSTQDQINSSYLSLMRAAWVIVALLALHSFVDYPLRTSAMASVAAFACALMLPARHHHRDHSHDAENETRPAYERAAARSHQQASDPVPGAKAAAPAEPREPPRPHQRWEAPVEWPEEWKPKAAGTTAKAASGWDVTTPKGDGGKDGGES